MGKRSKYIRRGYATVVITKERDENAVVKVEQVPLGGGPPGRHVQIGQARQKLIGPGLARAVTLYR
jgi:hypothetical protein